MLKRMLIFFLLVFVVISGWSADVDEVVKKANYMAYYQGDDMRSDVEMIITDSQNRVRRRAIKMLRMDIKDGGDQKFYLYFTTPADVEGMVYMVWKHINQDDDRWMYLPALDLVKRISARDKRSSFVGSDFVYEDISGRNITADEHKIISEDEHYIVLRNTPKKPESVEFAYYDVYVRKPDFLPVKIKFYDANGKLQRQIKALKIKIIDGHPTVVESMAEDYERGSKTRLVFSNVRYDVGLTEKIFTERYLRRPPRKWLR